jgi:Resolvase, N terminal domain
VSGSKDRRPALDVLVRDAKRRKFDVLVCWRLDRLGRNLRHLILFLDELSALGVAFVSLQEGIDATTPAGRLQLHVLGAIAEFERSRIQERVRAGIARARAAAFVWADQEDALIPNDSLPSQGCRSERRRVGLEYRVLPFNKRCPKRQIQGCKKFPTYNLPLHSAQRFMGARS